MSHYPARGDEDIRRLDVTMRDPLVVRCLQSVANLDGQIDNFIGTQERPTCPLTRT